MKVKGLDGRSYSLDLTGHTPAQDAGGSGPHMRARVLLAELFPCTVRAEEVYVPDIGLFLDFFLPSYKLVVEADGKQHREFVPFFHQNELNYFRSNLRDQKKDDWCDINQFRLVRLDDSLDDAEWRRLILAG